METALEINPALFDCHFPQVPGFVQAMALDFAAGCAGGAAGVIVGQPFDTVKVRLQTQGVGAAAQYKGMFDCVAKMVRQESPKSLYKGLTPPLIGLGLQNALIFGTQGQARKLVGDSQAGEFMAGALTGLVSSFVTGPVELAKTKLQVQGVGTKAKKSTKLKYRGPVQTMQTIYMEEGFRACFRGTLGVICRDVPATSIYFGSFTALNNLCLRPGETVDNLTPLHLVFTGGTAGILSWAVVYPIDIVKSRIQADGMKPHGRYASYHDCCVQGMREQGAKFLTVGFSATMVRAFPVNAAILCTVTMFLRLVHNKEVTEDFT